MTADGLRLDFAENGVWRLRAQRVRAARAALRAGGRFDALNDAFARPASAATASVAGVLSMPTVLVGFEGADTLVLPGRSRYDSLMYGVTAPGGMPYTLRRYYEELSNGLFSVGGATYGWVGADVSLDYVTEPCPASNGLCTSGLRRLTEGFRSVLESIDADVDFGQFDNDGPDGAPNSGDDDGAVDVVQFVQPYLGGECDGPGFWAHKSSFAANDGDSVNGPLTTDDPAAGGGQITVNSYYLTSGVGGPDCRDETGIMAIGVSAHELGHGLGLPDLYDTSFQSEGIGEWGLMGSGMYTSLPSPGHLGAWSKEQMGWVAVRELATSASVGLGPVQTSDTVLVIRRPNARGEYFLLENKQPVLADTANMLTGGRAGPKEGGLLVWHVDSTKVAGSLASNAVNAGSIRGVVLLQADGLNQLGGAVSAGNRGDAGDPFPGTSANSVLSPLSTPSATLNDGSPAGFQLEAIAPADESGAISFDVAVGVPNVIRATDTLARVRVDGLEVARFVGFLAPGVAYEIDIDSVQTSGDGRTTFEFVAWSDGGARTHSIADLPPGDSLLADVAVRHRLRVTPSGAGTVATAAGTDLAAGVFVRADSTVSVAAEPGAGMVLDSWGGDTSATGDTLTVVMTRPFDLQATFLPVLAFTDTLPAAAVAGAPYAYTLQADGGDGTYRFSVSAGALPPGLTLASDGTIQGLPEAEGDATVEVEVTSGMQRAVAGVRLQSVAPEIELGRVLDELLRLDVTLTQDERRYLDLLGNRNGAVDLGDFLAWTERLGVSPGAALRHRERAP